MDPEHRCMHIGPTSQHLCGRDLGSLHQVCEQGLSDARDSGKLHLSSLSIPVGQGGRASGRMDVVLEAIVWVLAW